MYQTNVLYDRVEHLFYFAYTAAMGNREALLSGAKQCLLDKGYARTTARDIAAAAHVSLAAIGYHFSSKEALLTEALLLAFGDWEIEFRQALNASVPQNATPLERFESTWTRLIDTFATHRSLWVANFELFSQMEHRPEIRRILGDNLHLARSGLAALFLNQPESAINERTAQTIGAFHHVLLSGMIAQWIIDPRLALTPRDLTETLRTIASSLETGPAAVSGRQAKKSTRAAKSGARVR